MKGQALNVTCITLLGVQGNYLGAENSPVRSLKFFNNIPTVSATVCSDLEKVLLFFGPISCYCISQYFSVTQTNQSYQY